MKFSNVSDAVRPAALQDFDSERRGSSIVSPLISLVGRELESKTGPVQETSKKTLIVMFAGEEEKVLLEMFDGLM